jgi:hypothetical protein
MPRILTSQDFFSRTFAVGCSPVFQAIEDFVLICFRVTVRPARER